MQVVNTYNATNVSPTTAVLSGNYSDLPPGNSINYVYRYGLCDTYPQNSSATAVTFVANPPPSGQLAPMTVLGLFSNAQYCAQLCVQVRYCGTGEAGHA